MDACNLESPMSLESQKMLPDDETSCLDQTGLIYGCGYISPERLLLIDSGLQQRYEVLTI